MLSWVPSWGWARSGEECEKYGEEECGNHGCFIPSCPSLSSSPTFLEGGFTNSLRCSRCICRMLSFLACSPASEPGKRPDMRWPDTNYLFRLFISWTDSFYASIPRGSHLLYQYIGASARDQVILLQHSVLVRLCARDKGSCKVYGSHSGLPRRNVKVGKARHCPPLPASFDINLALEMQPPSDISMVHRCV